MLAMAPLFLVMTQASGKDNVSWRPFGTPSSRLPGTM